MKKVSLIVILSLGIITAFAQTSQELSILELSKRKFDWLLNKQYDSLVKVLDDKVQYIHSNGWIQSKDEVVNDLKSGKLVYQKVEVKDSKVRLYSNSAIVTGLGRFEGVTNGTAFAMDLRYTEVYVKSGNLWKLASRHANKMP
ncbi:MAG: nuclear transport factor 2 family protein [Cyclobacteriaceae bacterium]|nr:nuclear transport factor 2 family protein [Cyclobacteriaceae bacterium]